MFLTQAQQQNNLSNLQKFEKFILKKISIMKKMYHETDMVI